MSIREWAMLLLVVLIAAYIWFLGYSYGRDRGIDWAINRIKGGSDERP